MCDIARIKNELGSIDEAIKIWRENVLPVYVRLGDVREHAMTMGFIADALFRKKNYKEAIMILRHDALPICERVGDVRALVVGRTNLAVYLNDRGWQKDRDEINFLLQRAYSAASTLGMPEKQEIALLYQKIFRKLVKT